MKLEDGKRNDTMNTETPLTDTVINNATVCNGDRVTELEKDLIKLARRLEHHCLELSAALETCRTELQTLAPRLSGSYRTNVQAAADLARITLTLKVRT